MKHTSRHGAFTIPAGWQDESTYTYVGPVAGESLPLLAGKGAKGVAGRPAVSVTTVEVPAGQKLSDVVAEQHNALAALVTDLALVKEPAWIHPAYGELRTVAFGFQLPGGGRLKQIAVYVPRTESSFVVFAFSALDGAFDAARPMFTGALASFVSSTAEER